MKTLYMWILYSAWIGLIGFALEHYDSIEGTNALLGTGVITLLWYLESREEKAATEESIQQQLEAIHRSVKARGYLR